MNEILEGYTRVTDVLNPFSGLDKVPKHILSMASERGTYVHQKIASINLNLGFYEPENIPDEWNLFVESFKIWASGRKFIKYNPRFYCDTYKITGITDDFYEEGDGLVLVDYKTPLNESKTWSLQGSAYSYLARMHGFNVKRIEFVKLSKHGSEPEVFKYQQNFHLFLSYLDVYRHSYVNRKEICELEFL